MKNLSLRNVEIDSLVEELRSQKLKKYDVVTPANSLEMVNGNFDINDIIPESQDNLFENLQISRPHEEISLSPTSHFHSQIAEKLGIPKNYYDKCLDQKSGIIEQNVNYWLKNNPKQYLIRSFKDSDGGGVARAFLSDRFKAIDNWDILITALDEIKNNPNIKIEACDLSETRMYVRFYDPSVEVQAPELLKNYRNPATGSVDSGSGIVSGFTLSNSEVGSGGFAIAPRGIILVCRNGMTQKKDQLRRIHLGEKQNTGFINWSDDTEIQNMRLIQSQTKDAIRTFLSPEYWNNVISNLNEDGTKILHHPLECTKNVCKSLSLSDKQTENVLNYFMDGGQRTRFGVSNALTFLAQTTENPDMQYSLEDSAMELIPVMAKYDVA